MIDRYVGHNCSRLQLLCTFFARNGIRVDLVDWPFGFVHFQYIDQCIYSLEVFLNTTCGLIVTLSSDSCECQAEGHLVYSVLLHVLPCTHSVGGGSVPRVLSSPCCYSNQVLQSGSYCPPAPVSFWQLDMRTCEGSSRRIEMMNYNYFLRFEPPLVVCNSKGLFTSITLYEKEIQCI